MGETALQGRPRRMAAILFCDIVGYSGLMSRDETQALACVREFEALLRELVPAHGGRIVKFMGDGSMAEFPLARPAVEAARAIQARLATRNAAPGATCRLDIRIGIHLGEVVEGDGGDILGDAVNVAARVQALAMPGGLALTDAVHQQVRGQVALGDTHQLPARLKNIPDWTRVVLVAPEGGVVPRSLRWRRWLAPAVAAALLVAVVPAVYALASMLTPTPNHVGILYVETLDADAPGAQALAHAVESELDRRFAPKFAPEWVAPDKIREIYTCLGVASDDTDSRLIHACPAVRRGGLAFVFTGRLRHQPAGWKLTLRTICTESRRPIKEFVAEGPDAKTLVDRLLADRELDTWISWFMQPPA